MKTLIPGERHPLESGEPRIVTAPEFPGEPDIAYALVGGDGSVRPIAMDGGRATIDLAGAVLPAQIVAWVANERGGGFVNARYPMIMDFGAGACRLKAPREQLAAVIVAEIYEKDGRSRLKVANEGYQFGIAAYARARGIDPRDFAVSAPRR